MTNGTSSNAATLTVGAGATAYAGTVVTAAWRDGAETLGSGTGWANLTLPAPEGYAHAKLQLRDSSPGRPMAHTLPVVLPWRQDSPETWQYRRNFSFFVTDPAGVSGSVQASIQGDAYAPASIYSTAAQQAVTVHPVLRTTVVYADRADIHASFVLRDSDGRSVVADDGLTVQMTATGPLGSLTSSSVS